MKKTGLVCPRIALERSRYAQTPYFQGKTIRIIVGYPAGQRPRLMGAADRDTVRQAYSRESSHRRTEYARRRFDDRDQLRLQRG